MQRVKRRIFSGVVCEQEVYTVSDRANIKKAEPRPRFKDDEERAQHRIGISKRKHQRLVNENFSPLSLYSTLTFDDDSEVHTFSEARRIRDNYFRRLQRACPDAKIIIYMGRGKSKMPVPTEAQEQMTLFSWAAMQSGKYPELNLLYHVPNGGSRHKAEAGRLRAEGVKAGVPDLCLPVARGQYHGLYIELKRQRVGRTSDHQSEWLDALSAQGYKAALCYGWEQAAGTIIEYLTGGGTHD